MTIQGTGGSFDALTGIRRATAEEHGTLAALEMTEGLLPSNVTAMACEMQTARAPVVFALALAQRLT
jgi:hypothetical protein